MMLNPNLRSKMMRNEEKTEILEFHQLRKNHEHEKNDMFDVRTQRRDLGIRPLGDLMMLNPIGGSKMTPERRQN